MPLTQEYLNEVRKRCDLATPGPWISFIEGRDHTSGDSFIRRTLDDSTTDHGLYLRGEVVTVEDQDFIAHARMDIPLLLDEITHLHRLLEECESEKGK